MGTPAAPLPAPFDGLIGAAASMRELIAHLGRVAKTDSPVLVCGETGTGKELVARAIHDASPRSRAPFVVVDCTALPPTLLESELMGHAKGAFTDAREARAGVFEAAAGGTVFLDEIGDLPLASQPALLRVLESRTVRRIGEVHYRPVDVRFVAATHRDLLAMVDEGTFREDLYFRLSVLPVFVPPLRERTEDIEAIVRHLLAPAQHGMLTLEVVEALRMLPWRGNVRELRNFVDRAQALGPLEALRAMTNEEPLARPDRSRVTPIPPERVPDPDVYDLAYRDFRERWIEHGEREYIRRRLVMHGRSVTAVARDVDLARAHIYRLMRKHAL